MKVMLKTRQKFKSKKHNAFTEETHKFSVSSNDDKRFHLIDSVATYAYGANKDLLHWK